MISLALCISGIEGMTGAAVPAYFPHCLNGKYDAIVVGTIVKPLSDNVFIFRIERHLSGRVSGRRIKIEYIAVNDTCSMYVPSSLNEPPDGQRFIAYLYNGTFLRHRPNIEWGLGMMISPDSISGRGFDIPGSEARVGSPAHLPGRVGNQ